MNEQHWSEIHRIGEVREIKWAVSAALTFWIDGGDPLDMDFLTAEQQPTFDRYIVVFRDSLYLAFPKASSASTRLELHGILDMIDIGYKRNKSTKSALMLQEDFEEGVFKPKKKQQKGRSVKRDSSGGDIASTEDMIAYIENQSWALANESFQTNEKWFQSVFAQLAYGVKTVFPLPTQFEKRVILLRLLDEIYVECELGNKDNIGASLSRLREAILPKSLWKRMLDLLKSR